MDLPFPAVPTGTTSRFELTGEHGSRSAAFYRQTTMLMPVRPLPVFAYVSAGYRFSDDLTRRRLSCEADDSATCFF